MKTEALTQVLCQAVALKQGLVYYGRNKGFVIGMAARCREFLSPDVCYSLGMAEGGGGKQGPHKSDKNAWSRRPLSPESLAYAATDCWAIWMLLEKLREEEPLDDEWLNRVMAGSVAYCRLFRDAEHAVKWPEDRLMFLHERAI